MGFDQRDNTPSESRQTAAAGWLCSRERNFGAASIRCLLKSSTKRRTGSRSTADYATRITRGRSLRIQRTRAPAWRFDLPKLDWVLRGFYGRYYQPPPLSTVSGPLLNLALQQGFGFLPLHGERDEEWKLASRFPTAAGRSTRIIFRRARAISLITTCSATSNIFFPLTIAGVGFVAGKRRAFAAAFRSRRMAPRVFSPVRGGRGRSHRRSHRFHTAATWLFFSRP